MTSGCAYQERKKDFNAAEEQYLHGIHMAPDDPGVLNNYAIFLQVFILELGVILEISHVWLGFIFSILYALSYLSVASTWRGSHMALRILVLLQAILFPCLQQDCATFFKMSHHSRAVILQSSHVISPFPGCEATRIHGS